MHPRVVGIVNLTRDSFSDGGRLAEPSAAVAHALSLVADGAALIDLGPAASNPDAVPVSAAEEIRRLEPVLDGVLARGVTVSVDSCQVETQRYAVARGVAYLNDIRGFPDPSLYEELARARCRLVVMHAVQRGPAATRELVDPHGVVDRVTSFFAERVAALESAGVSRDRIILDPGMGYFLGGVAEASLAVLRALGELKARFGRPLWILGLAQVVPRDADRARRVRTRSGNPGGGAVGRRARSRLHPHPRRACAVRRRRRRPRPPGARLGIG